VIVWAVVALGACLLVRGFRGSIPSILKAFFVPKILLPVLALVAVVVAEVVLARELGAWTPSLATDTAFWFVSVAFVMLLTINRVWEQPGFFRRAMVSAFAVSALLEGFNEVFVLPLWLELTLVPFAALLALVSLSAEIGDRKYPGIKRFCEGALVVLGLGLLGQAAFQLISSWDTIDKGDVLRQVVQPVWLLAGVVPFLYLLGVYAIYEQTLIRMRLSSPLGRWGRLRNGAVLFGAYGFRAHALGDAEGKLAWHLGQATSASVARDAIEASRQRQRDEARRAAEAEDRLVRFAGADGEDSAGRRLDRREFDATTQALDWFAMCMMGWHRNQGGRYPADLLERLGDDFSRQGLPVPSGVVLRVSRDGQRFYAWRRTVTGWCFAIGAATEPPDQWRYDGPGPPSGYPGSDEAWGPSSFDMDVAPNWS
jgi:hypothetical protein